MLISEKGKCIQAIWLSQKSFYGKSIPVFGSSKHFSEIVLWKINSGVWFVQTFFGNRFTENQFRCLVHTNILRKITSVLRKINSHVCFGQTFYEKWNSFFTENQFLCLVCGSFYGKQQFQASALPKQTCNSTKIFIQIQASALPKHICNSTKIFIHFNIKNNHLNIPIILK